MTFPTRSNARLAALLLATVAATPAAGGTIIEVSDDAPDLDRWNYPFNGTPGFRTFASTFLALGFEEFDNRDAQLLLGFDTGDDVPTGLPLERYQVLSARVTVMFDGQSNEVIYDDTIDPVENFYDPADEEYVPDADPGHPVELFGTGFRNGFTADTYLENSPFGPIAVGTRNAYAASFDDDGQLIDISNHVRDRFEPLRFAVGSVDGVTPGDPLPANAVYAFDLNLEQPEIHAYVAESLRSGRLRLSVTSTHIVDIMEGIFPTFYTKENPLVEIGQASAATLELTVEILDESTPADINGDGVVDVNDLLLLLAAWGTCDDPSDCPEDLDGDAEVGVTDLLTLLAAWD